MIWFTSDLHFGHNKAFVYNPRGFESLEDMENKIIENWNNKVNPNDIIYVLGDFFLGSDYDKIDNILSKLTGNIYFIRGNHDTDKKLEFYEKYWSNKIHFITLQENPIKYKKKLFYLSHYPTLTSNLEADPKKCVINLHGHTHSKYLFYNEIPFMYNVALDAHNNDLVSIDKICDDINDKIKECLEYLK